MEFLKRTRPTVFIASPYSQGDPALNTHFQCSVFNKLLGDRRVLPFAPLWSHFQHTLFPRAYADWIEYDQSILHLFDCCLRLDAEIPHLEYRQHFSKGADAEVDSFRRLGKPVFFSIGELYAWVDRNLQK